jgi:sugar phosphate isomerase/epimerase
MLYLMALPGVAVLFVVSYQPMPGVILAFKNYKPATGIWGSEWVGLYNFGFLLNSGIAWQIIRNTLLLNRIKVAMDLAASTNCNHVSPWPGHDGWDYVFQTDYIKMYDWMLEGLEECANHNPNVKISLEFKPKEPRMHIMINSTAKALLFVNTINKPNLGINLDVGHANMGGETLAEAVALMKRFGNRLLHLHLNDNYRSTDDDMIPGSVHTLEWVEFFWWLKKTGYDGWYSLDIFAYRERDKIAVARESLAWLDLLGQAADRIDDAEAEAIFASGDAMKAQAMLRKALFG